jgi:hypothetical protein
MLMSIDGEFFQSESTMECLAQMATLKDFYIGENNITSAILHRQSQQGMYIYVYIGIVM